MGHSSGLVLVHFSAIVDALRRRYGQEEKGVAEATSRTIPRVTRKKYTAEDKIRIVLERLRGESGIRELCRREGIATSLYYSWSKEFLEAGKHRLLGDTQRQATSRTVADLRTEVDQLKQLVAELSLKTRELHTCPGGRCQGKNLRGQE
jgi:transposase